MEWGCHCERHDSAGFSRGECGGEFDCAKYVDCEGEERDPGRYSGIVGMSSKTCWATGRLERGPVVGCVLSAFMTP